MHGFKPWSKNKEMDACMGKDRSQQAVFLMGRGEGKVKGRGQLCCLKLRLDDSAPSICHCCLNKDC